MKSVSASLIWMFISTPNGLAEWFADSVQKDGKVFTFYWNKSSQRANLIAIRNGQYVRFRWEDEPADTYFELAIHRLELTRDVALTVTDFAEDGDTEDAIRLWNSQIDDLRRIAGM